jgi:hypothetical protein
MTELTCARLREVLNYDARTGIWIWRKSTGPRAKVGARAGNISLKDAYRRISVDGKLYKSGRLAHLYVTGEWPKNLVDHRNLKRSDDRWDNLRDATRTQNGANTSLKRSNKSGFKGVSWKTSSQKWVAQIAVNQRVIYLGIFGTKKAAHEAYCAASRRHFGEFARVA